MLPKNMMRLLCKTADKLIGHGLSDHQITNEDNSSSWEQSVGLNFAPISTTAMSLQSRLRKKLGQPLKSTLSDHDDGSLAHLSRAYSVS